MRIVVGLCRKEKPDWAADQREEKLDDVSGGERWYEKDLNRQEWLLARLRFQIVFSKIVSVTSF